MAFCWLSLAKPPIFSPPKHAHCKNPFHDPLCQTEGVSLKDQAKEVVPILAEIEGKRVEELAEMEKKQFDGPANKEIGKLFEKLITKYPNFSYVYLLTKEPFDRGWGCGPESSQAVMFSFWKSWDNTSHLEKRLNPGQTSYIKKHG